MVPHNNHVERLNNQHPFTACQKRKPDFNTAQLLLGNLPTYPSHCSFQISIPHTNKLIPEFHTTMQQTHSKSPYLNATNFVACLQDHRGIVGYHPPPCSLIPDPKGSLISIIPFRNTPPLTKTTILIKPRNLQTSTLRVQTCPCPGELQGFLPWPDPGISVQYRC